VLVHMSDIIVFMKTLSSLHGQCTACVGAPPACCDVRPLPLDPARPATPSSNIPVCLLVSVLASVTVFTTTPAGRAAGPPWHGAG
jgi:hypothetical protein